MKDALFDQVSALLCETAEQQVLPRFRVLQEHEIEEKSPGEVVTVADRAVEMQLAPRLAALRPGSRVVGEEGVAANPALLHGLHEGEVWIVDPIDGTANFIAGRDSFALMVALLRGGEALASWMYFPVSHALAVAARGQGAYLDGARLRVPPRHPARPSALRGIVKTGFIPPPHQDVMEARAQAQVRERVPGTQSACGDYVNYAKGEVDFGLYWRMLPWDHAPGALLLTEAGGRVARADGKPYRGADQGTGLLVARSSEVWEQAHAALGWF